MSQKIYRRERYKRLNAKKKLQFTPGLFWGRYFLTNKQQLESGRDWQFQDQSRQKSLLKFKREASKSVHNGICQCSSEFFHPIWRKAAKNICRLHLLGLTDEADNLDPQPKRLGIMWFIY
jgi:hypothetical protein